MIKYHILALLCLVAAAISGIEFLAIATLDHPNDYLSHGRFWLMIGVFAFSIMLYIRVRRFRKEEMKEK